MDDVVLRSNHTNTYTMKKNTKKIPTSTTKKPQKKLAKKTHAHTQLQKLQKQEQKKPKEKKKTPTKIKLNMRSKNHR